MRLAVVKGQEIPSRNSAPLAGVPLPYLRHPGQRRRALEHRNLDDRGRHECHSGECRIDPEVRSHPVTKAGQHCSFANQIQAFRYVAADAVCSLTGVRGTAVDRTNLLNHQIHIGGGDDRPG